MLGVDLQGLISEVRKGAEELVFSRVPGASRFFILFSGGRDSFLASYAVLEALSSREDLDFYLIYVDHGMDFPWSLAVSVRALEFLSSEYSAPVHVLQPSEGFWDYVFVKRYLFPVPERRWYVKHLVVRPLREFFNRVLHPGSLSTDVVVMGSRCEDSSSRVSCDPGRVSNVGTHNVTGLLAFFPVAGLSVARVRELVDESPFPAYNDFYPASGVGKPGFWAYLSDRTLAYHRFAVRAGFPCAEDLFSFVSVVSDMQADPAFLGPRRRRWNDRALARIADMAEDLYITLSDCYPGLYTSEDVRRVRDLGSKFRDIPVL